MSTRAARGVASGGAEPGSAEPGVAESEGAGSGGAEPVGAEPGGAEPAGVESKGAEPEGVEPGGAESGGAEPRGTASSGDLAGASPRLSPRPEPLSPQQLREWFTQRTHLRSGATGAGDSATGDTGAGGAGVTAGAGGTRGATAAGLGGARTRGIGAAGTSTVGGAGAGNSTEPGAAGDGGTGTRGARTVGAGAGSTRAGGAGDGGAGAVDPGAKGARAEGAVSSGTGAGGTVRPRAYFVPLLQQVLGVPFSRGLTSPLLSPPRDQSHSLLQPASALLAPSPSTEQVGNLKERLVPASRPASPVRTGRRVPRPRPPPVPGTHAMAVRPVSVPVRVPLPAPRESSLLAVPNPKSDGARAASPTISCLLATIVNDPSFESTAASALVAELAITGPYSSQWQKVMDAKMASLKSTGTYVNVVPPSGANIVDGMWIFRVKRPPGSPPAFKARYIARGFRQRQGVNYFHTFSPTPKMTTLRVLLHVAAQRDYELHSLDFSTAFLRGSLHEEIWLRRQPGFTGTFPAGTQWSLRRPVYDLRQAPREWHDTLRTTLAALGFTPSIADPSLFLRTDTSLPPFYVLVYVDDLVFATADTEALTLVKSELQKRHTCTDTGPSALRLPVLLATAHSSVYRPLTLSSTFGQPLGSLRGSRTLGMGLVLGGRSPFVLTGHADASWVDDSATQRSSQGYTFSLSSGSVSWWSTRSSSVLSSSCEVEIYAGDMAAQCWMHELRWLTNLLTDLGEQPRLPLVLYVDNKAMIALCQEHRLEHRMKHIALRYFLARWLQQRGQIRLAYVATKANTADIFTKALPHGDHQRFSTVLGLVPTLPHLFGA
ncbi:unnamed protein product [Closterium sp. NIES-53]